VRIVKITPLQEYGSDKLEPPTHGFSVRHSKNLTTDKTKTCGTGREGWTLQWTHESQKHNEINVPDELAAIVNCWHDLPEHIKQAILTLAKCSK